MSIQMNKNYWVYILYCNNDSYYTGFTTDLTKRYQAHLNGTASKYTRSFKPLSLVQCWKIGTDKSLALRMEYFIKKLPRNEKEKIIRQPTLLTFNSK